MDKRRESQTPSPESPALAGPDYLSLVIEWEAPKEWEVIEEIEEWDLVDEASAESFPASDPPGWGSAHAVPSQTTVADEITTPNRSHPHGLAGALRAIAVAAIGLGSLIMLAARMRRARA